jgi:hypothetical protein
VPKSLPEYPGPWSCTGAAEALTVAARFTARLVRERRARAAVHGTNCDATADAILSLAAVVNGGELMGWFTDKGRRIL